ncbi:MAG: hypothetical protein IJL02_05920 [Methanobrevibacter sp.]|uniref:hypothetical protein n=1 Tax=Methanobrevibacter sp. TaxID=66852 RepID=UPI0025D117AB|nr:hypothetical protein [Methanobrevibacter sp.]MBQ6099384.1 hypothetical protein [Methanobrevibacter sp.]
MLDFDKFRDEIIEFCTKDTLKAIDWGLLDLGGVENCELKEVLLAVENALALELENNYRQNDTGIFRVFKTSEFWYYDEEGYIIRAESLGELKRLVESQNRIWYVFDEISLENFGGMTD